MRLVHATRHLGVSIERPPADVYAFASDPANLPLWAKGLSGSIANVDGEWVADSPMGRLKVRFVPQNPYGVLDHDVELETGETVHVPLRVVPNGAGSELVFTLVRRRGVTDEEFEADADAIRRDLGALKALLEAR
jgi:hypothetical protein